MKESNYEAKTDADRGKLLDFKWGTLSIEEIRGILDALPFDLNFIDEDGKPYRPITIHRALLGSIERFFGVLIEHYAGNFPLWLAPVQIKIMPIADRHQDYALQIEKTLMAEGMRVETDSRNEKVGYKIREAELQKIPYMIIIGDKELESK